MFAHRYSINSTFTVNSSLFIHQCGWENCKPGHTFGPAIRDHHLMHFIFRGSGLLHIGNKNYSVSEGQGFLLSPGVSAIYIADKENPWYYGWMGFNGPDSINILAHFNITKENPVFSVQDVDNAEKCILEITECYGREGNTFLSISKMFELFSYLEPHIKIKKGHIIDTATKFIENNYNSGITVNDISGHVNLTRSQLFRIFKSAFNISPQQYLLQFKLDKAASLLRTSFLSVNEVATQSGYGNLCNFSRQFKIAYGYSPQEYRRRCTRNVAFKDGESSAD